MNADQRQLRILNIIASFGMLLGLPSCDKPKEGAAGGAKPSSELSTQNNAGKAIEKSPDTESAHELRLREKARVISNLWNSPLEPDDFSRISSQIDDMIEKFQTDGQDAKNVVDQLRNLARVQADHRVESLDPALEHSLRKEVLLLRLSEFVELQACPPAERTRYLRLLDTLYKLSTERPDLTSESLVAMMMLLGTRVGEAGMGGLSQQELARLEKLPREERLWPNCAYRKRIKKLGVDPSLQ